MDIQLVGVVGIGLMGSGIVETCARAGFDIFAREVNETLIDRGLTYLRGSLDRGVKRGKLSQDEMEAALARVKTTTSLTDLKDCDLVIEAAVENMQLKKTIFTELDAITRPEAILASHVVAEHHRDRLGHRTARQGAGAALLQPRAGDAAGRDRARAVDQ